MTTSHALYDSTATTGPVSGTVSYLSAGLRIATLVLALCLAAGLAGSRVVAEEAQSTESTQRVNINTASAEALAAGLNGVGMARAEDIVRHRESFGPFATLEELTEVKGIGRATIDKNRSVITLE
jgi:competence protein ComEA